MKHLLIIATTVMFGFVGSAGLAVANPDSHKQLDVQVGMSHSRLGAGVSSMTPDLRRYFQAPTDAGILVTSVESGSSAAKAGLRVGDVIIEVDGDKVAQPWDVIRALSGKNKGDKADIVVIRDKNRQTLTAVMGEPSATGDVHVLGGLDHDFDIDDFTDFNDAFQHFRGAFPLPLGDRALRKELSQMRARVKALEKRLDALEHKSNR